MADSPLNKFISEIKSRDIARANRYAVTIIPPKLMQGHPDSTSNNVQFVNMMCESTVIPGVALETDIVHMPGETRSMPVLRDYSTMSLSFYVDKNMAVRRFFDRWIASIIDQKTRKLSYYDDYISTINIRTVDVVTADPGFKDNSNKYAAYSVTLFEAYPKMLHDIQVSYSSDQIMTLRVDIEYKYWTTNYSENYGDNYGTPSTSSDTNNPSGQTTGNNVKFTGGGSYHNGIYEEKF